ncbi:hypothetical protein [Vallitalea guaymasensis]|uniref:hypothetical protein n=1 Tax=Vallitalea guaymasensis TaxID=1185412 RepID=UPI000DE3DF93|nr:hypothetical protein [Vallitalea guaymasensis]
MKNHKTKPYQEIHKKLNIYLDNRYENTYIDEQAKDKIWNNIIKEVHEEKLKRNYLIRRRYKTAITACLLIVALISVDLSSNASLFKRLFHSINDNTIEFYTRDNKSCTENRNYELDDNIVAINEKGGRKFISPIVPDNYSVQNINESGSNIIITMSSNNNIIEISQKYITNRDSTGMVKYNEDLFKIQTFTNGGVEYNIIKNDNLIITLFVIDEIEFEVLGNNKQDVLDITMSLHY